MNGLSYSRFMNGMKLAGVDINRKMLSEIAINDPKAFADLVELAKKALKRLISDASLSRIFYILFIFYKFNFIQTFI